MLGKKYVEVPVEFAERIENATNEAAQVKVIEDIIANAKDYFKEQLSVLDDDVLTFKGMLTSYKTKYRETLEAHQEATYQIWENIEAETPKVAALAKKHSDMIGDVKDQLQEIANLAKDISQVFLGTNSYHLEKMVSLVREINSMDQFARDLFSKALDAYRLEKEK